MKDFDNTLKNNFPKLKERTWKEVTDSLLAYIWDLYKPSNSNFLIPIRIVLFLGVVEDLFDEGNHNSTSYW